MQPIPLEFWSVCLRVPQSPGAYGLVDRSGFVLYVGRSDGDLRQRSLAHIGNSETNQRIRDAKPVAIVVQPTETIFDAYDLESFWYDLYRPICNEIRPAKPSNYDLWAALLGAARPAPAAAYGSPGLSALLSGILGGQPAPAPAYGSPNLSALLSGVLG
jgi:hypothetical protein